MSSDERAVWLTTAWAEVSDIPSAAFLDSCQQARRGIDHPAKLIPFIVRESEEYGAFLRKRYENELAIWENQKGPRLESPSSAPTFHQIMDQLERREIPAPILNNVPLQWRLIAVERGFLRITDDGEFIPRPSRQPYAD